MILKETVLQVIRNQKKELKKMKMGIIRNELNNVGKNGPYAIITTRIRRCGKSTLLLQLMMSSSSYVYVTSSHG
jgi:predicted AAA+ superfamily ATPase